MIRRDLTNWNKTSFGKIETMIQNTKNNIENLRYLNPNVNTITKEIKLNEKNLEGFLCREDELRRQKSRELWLKEGDKNIRFFHAITTNKRRLNKIEILKNFKGSWLKKRENIGDELHNYLSKTLSTS